MAANTSRGMCAQLTFTVGTGMPGRVTDSGYYEWVSIPHCADIGLKPFLRRKVRLPSWPTLDRIAVAKSATKSRKIARNRAKSRKIACDFADDPVEGRPID